MLSVTYREYFQKWEIRGELLQVQGCIERALELLPYTFKCQRIETLASREYRFKHSHFDEIGFVKATVLRDPITQFNVHIPGPTSKWLILEYLPTKLDNLKTLPLLYRFIVACHRQIEDNYLKLSPYERSFAEGMWQIDQVFFKQTSNNDELAEKLNGELEIWRSYVHMFRENKISIIIRMIEKQFKAAGFSFTKWDEKQASQTSEKSVSASGSTLIPSTDVQVNSKRDMIQETKSDSIVAPSARIDALNKLAILWVNYNQTQRISKSDGMAWFLGEYAEKVGVIYVSVWEFKRHLAKAYKAKIIGKDKKTGRFIPK